MKTRRAAGWYSVTRLSSWPEAPLPWHSSSMKCSPHLHTHKPQLAKQCVCVSRKARGPSCQVCMQDHVLRAPGSCRSQSVSRHFLARPEGRSLIETSPQLIKEERCVWRLRFRKGCEIPISGLLLVICHGQPCQVGFFTEPLTLTFPLSQPELRSP